MTDTPRKPRHTLTDDAIETRRGVSRRSMLLGTLGGGAALMTGTAALAASDADTGRYADPASRIGIGYSDNGSGSNLDPAPHGSDMPFGNGTSDTDSGSNEDPARQGYTGHSDTDSMSSSGGDRAGRGRP